jgi:hypothetical protein
MTVKINKKLFKSISIEEKFELTRNIKNMMVAKSAMNNKLRIPETLCK